MALQNLRSSTPSKRPDASSMSDGQIALNTAAASAGLFFKDSNGDLVKTGPVHIGTTAPNSTPATGGSTGNSKGEAWLDTSNSNYVLKIYDGTAWQSVEIAAGSARQLLQTNAAGTDVEFTSNVDVPGTLDVTGATTLDSTASVAGLLSANGKISFAEGNASAPGIYPGSDTDTGISSPSLNELSFSTAGTSRLYIDSSGEIGVGTTTPGYALDVRSGDGRFKRSASNAAAIYLGNTSSNYIYGDSDSNLLAFGTNGSEKLRITSSGNIGVGTSSPNDKLSVVSTSGTVGASVTAAGNAYLVLDSGVGGTSGNQITFIDFKNNSTVKGNISVNEGVTGQPLEINSATSNNVVIATGGGNVGINALSPSYPLDVSGNMRVGSSTGYAFIQYGSDSTSTDNWHLGSEGDGTFRFYNGVIGAGSEKMRITSGGNVGIGTSSPDRLVHIQKGNAGSAVSDNNTVLMVENSNHAIIQMASPNTVSNRILFGDPQDADAGRLTYDHNIDAFDIVVNGSEAMRITSSGNVGIGEAAPGNKLVVRGNPLFGPTNTTDQFQGLSFKHGKDSSANLAVNFVDFRNNLDVADTHIFCNHHTDGSSDLYFGTTPAGARNTDRRSEKMRISGAGNVGIGTSSPQVGILDLTRNGTAGTISSYRQLRFGLDANPNYSGFIGYGASVSGQQSGLIIESLDNGNTSKTIINPSGGNVGINTASPSYSLDVEGGPSSAQFTSTANWNFSNVYIRRKASNIGIAKMISMMLDGDSASSTNLTSSLNIWGTFSGTPTTSSTSSALNAAMNLGAPEAILFHTNGSERARIANNGHVQIHTTGIFPGSGNTTTGAMFEKAGDGTTLFVSRNNNVVAYFNRNSDGTNVRFLRSGNEVGKVEVGVSSTTYATSSDYRLKENVVSISDGITRVKQLAPKRFNFIADADTTVDGFLAHEAQTVVPEAVTGSKDEVDDEGNPVMQGIDQAKLVPLLTAALQEAIAKIETLETKVAALEAE